MAKVIVMPKMGEAMEEGQITEWLVKEGDKVAKNQSLFELMTDKTTMEFPCPEDHGRGRGGLSLRHPHRHHRRAG